MYNNGVAITTFAMASFITLLIMLTGLVISAILMKRYQGDREHKRTGMHGNVPVRESVP